MQVVFIYFNNNCFCDTLIYVNEVILGTVPLHILLILRDDSLCYSYNQLWGSCRQSTALIGPS